MDTLVYQFKVTLQEIEPSIKGTLLTKRNNCGIKRFVWENLPGELHSVWLEDAENREERLGLQV